MSFDFLVLDSFVFVTDLHEMIVTVMLNYIWKQDLRNGVVSIDDWSVRYASYSADVKLFFFWKQDL